VRLQRLLQPRLGHARYQPGQKMPLERPVSRGGFKAVTPGCATAPCARARERERLNCRRLLEQWLRRDSKNHASAPVPSNQPSKSGRIGCRGGLNVLIIALHHISWQAAFRPRPAPRLLAELGPSSQPRWPLVGDRVCHRRCWAANRPRPVHRAWLKPVDHPGPTPASATTCNGAELRLARWIPAHRLDV